MPSSDRAEMRPLAAVAGVGGGAGAAAACGLASEAVPSRYLDAWHHSSSSSRTSLPAIACAAASSRSALSEARETAAEEALLAVSTGGTPRRAEDSGAEGRGSS